VKIGRADSNISEKMYGRKSAIVRPRRQLLSAHTLGENIVMTLTGLFAFLGAPLANQRWSWGAVRPTDGAVILRVWQDEGRKIDGAAFTQITFMGPTEASASNLGYAERLKHVELIRNGAPSYMVMCQALDVKAAPRVVASFDRNDVFVGGRLIDFDGDAWLERIARRPVSSVRPQR
jgi:hypothetical protein